MGVNPLVSILMIALGAFLLYLIKVMFEILSTAPLMIPVAGGGAVLLILLGVYLLATSRAGNGKAS
ncbi:MAG: hypothetical protein ABIO39_05390 [Caulobacteraceae bacterium]